MRVASVRVVFAMAACLVGLAGCESYNKTVAWLNTPPGDQQASATGSGSATTTGTSANASPAEPDTTGSIGPPGPDPVAAGVVPPGEDPNDDLNLGKRHFREANYGLAERYFRRAAEKAPGEAHRDAEAWLGLAASYDRLRRFELADRAYGQAMKTLGPTPELLNNHGYSFLMRGDYRRAREKLLAARAKDPDSPYIQNNIALLEKSERRSRAPH
jgi:tetratricopeptide (TPR) repeat protein